MTLLFIKMACKQNLDLRCVLISDPGTLGAGAKTRLHTPKAVTYHEQPHYCRFMIGHSVGRMESRIKKFTPHCVCRPEAKKLAAESYRILHAALGPTRKWTMDANDLLCQLDAASTTPTSTTPASTIPATVIPTTATRDVQKDKEFITMM